MSLINDALKRAGEAPAPPPPPPALPPSGTVKFRELAPPKGSQLPVIISSTALILIVALASFFLVRGLTRKKTSGWQNSVQPVFAREKPQQTPASPSDNTSDLAGTANAKTAPKANTAPAGAPNAPVAAAANPPALPVLGTNGLPPLKVQGIFYRAKNPAAVINAKTVFVGDRVSDAKIIAITKDSVTVEFKGTTQVLTLY